MINEEIVFCLFEDKLYLWLVYDSSNADDSNEGSGEMLK
jgi:hypothetical protein